MSTCDLATDSSSALDGNSKLEFGLRATPFSEENIMKLPKQVAPVRRETGYSMTKIGAGFNAVTPQFFCPFGCGVVNCGQGRYCVDTGFMSCDCRVG
jgi:hypothetical protein